MWQRQPTLALTGSTPTDSPGNFEQPQFEATDPRWVLAIKTADALQGEVLGIDNRNKLLQLGETIGLTNFDTNLIIAIVQDQARRGYKPQACPAAAVDQLAMVPLPQDKVIPKRLWANMTYALIALFVAEAFLIWWWLG
jgi:hypothetical protein